MIYWIFITIINWFVALSLTLALCLALQLYFSISPIAFSTTLYILLSILRPQLFSLFPITIHPSMFFSLSFPVQLWLILLYFSLPLILLHPYFYFCLSISYLSLNIFFYISFSLNLSAYVYYLNFLILYLKLSSILQYISIFLFIYKNK